jgi:2-octaprenyl-6-methoxyphenol hydroxylase
VPNRVIGAALTQASAGCPAVRVVAGRVTGTSLDGATRSIDVDAGTGPSRFDARLVVAADGAQSMLRDQGGISAEHWEYEQTALVTTLATQRFHDHVAYERFTPDGPLAVLPLADGRCGLVWTQAPAEADRLLEVGDAEFLVELQRAFGMRLGRLLAVGPRQAYPLALTRAERHVGGRLAIVGNAAQGLHPIAGQGFNLGLRDAACLAEVLADAAAEGVADPGDAATLDAYAVWRDEDRRRIVAFTDGLVRVFGSPLGLVRRLRTLGLVAFDTLPPAKDALARLSVGAAGRIPRLARGVPLVRRHA